MIGIRLAQRYELVRELGRGGMGIVYLARDPELERDVAIKVLSVAELGEDARERFLREAQIVARMDHPSIVPIYDLGRDEDMLFFVMPVVRGETLQALVRRGDLVLGEVLEIVAQVAEALDYSHQRGVVHRDVKPENVMVVSDEDKLRARVMDFGLALRGAASRLTGSGNLPGTLGYLSPEQILAVEVDGRSDLYSLGTILYECLAGKPPFAGSRYSLLYRIVNEEPPPLLDLGVDPRLEELVLACLAKDPAERPARGNDLAAALRALAASLSGSGSLREVGVYRPGTGALERTSAAPLVGREREVAELRRRLVLAAGGECQLVLIGGEPGIGKTRLLEELGETARIRGFRVLRGRFSDQESAFPFQAFGELIQDFYLSKEIASSSASALPDLGDLENDLRAVFPALSELKTLAPHGAAAAGRDAAAPVASSWVPSSWETPAEEGGAEPSEQGAPFALAAARRGDPTHLFELLATTLTRLARGKPTVYLLEHLHAAQISIDALQYVVRRLGPTPSVFAGTYRPSEVTRLHPLARLLKSVRDEPRFASLALGPLAFEELRELVASRLGGGELTRELAERLHESTEGNPFFALELARSFVDAGDVRRGPNGTWRLSGDAALHPGSLPETIQQAVESRLERLPGAVLEVLKTASVLGRTFDYQDLEALVDEDVDDAVERLLAEGLLHEDRKARSNLLHFASGVVRDVLHGDLSRRRRRMLHRAHAENLERRWSGRLERIRPRLVHHFAEGDVAGKTVEHALRLAERSLDAVGAGVVVRVLGTALDFVEDEAIDRSTEGQLRLLLARALRSTGSNEAAVKEAAKAFRVFDQVDDATAAADAALVAAETSWQGRRVGDTRLWVDKGIEVARAAHSTEALRKLLTLSSTVANLRGEHQQARLRWEEAQELVAAARPAEEPPARGGTLRVLIPGRITTLDPRRAVIMEEGEVLANVFETLIESDADGNLRPLLCNGWEKSDDGRCFVLRLSRDVRFSDGRPFGAHDVRRTFASFDRAASWLPMACAVLAPPAEASAAPGVEVVDEHTVRFHLREPTPIFPALLSDLKTAVFRVGEGGELCGTGPFRLAASGPDGIRLTRNPHYRRRDRPLLDAIEFRKHSESVAEDLRSGRLDVGRELPPEQLDQLLRDVRFRSGLVETTRPNVFVALTHLTGPVTRQRAVRRALLRGVRVQDLVWRTLGRGAQPAASLIPPGILGHDPGRRRRVLSREETEELLRASDVETPVELTAAVHPVVVERFPAFLEALLGDWRAAGLEVAFDRESLEDFLARSRDARGIDLWIGRWIPDYDDPDAFLLGLLHSEQGFLAPWVGSSALDDLILAARREENAAGRQRLYRQLEDFLIDEDAVLPLFYEVDYRLVGPRVRGLELLGRPPYVNYSEVTKVARAQAVEPPRETGVIQVPLGATFGDLAPRQAQILGNVEMAGTVFETLTRLDEGARIVPCLASEFRLENGGRRFRFKLRGNVRFHDGRKLTVRDVRFTFEELIRGLGRESFEAGLVPIRGGRSFWEGESSELEGFVIVSANELVIDLDRPLSFFPAMLTSAATAIVPEGSRRFDGDWRQGTVGTGPFRVLRFAAGERLELEAHPHYWRRGLPKNERLVFELGLEPEEILNDFRAGRLAVAAGLRPGDVDELLGEPRFAAGFREMPGFSTCFLVLDTRNGPLADPELRAVFRRRIEDADLASSTLGRLGTPAQGLIPPGLLGYEPHSRRERGESERSSGEPPLAGIELRTAVFPSFLGAFSPYWEALVRTLEAAGARLRVIAASPIETLWRIARGEVDLAAARWAASYPDPDALIHFFHTCGYLGTVVGNPELDELFDRGRAETDTALRHTIYRQIDHLLSRHDALVPLFHEQVCRVAHPDLAGLSLRFGWPEVAYEELGLTP